MNSRICYMYRDACNYKSFNEVVVAGVVDEGVLRGELREAAYFIAWDVGLPELQSEDWAECDHIWHELEGVEPTADAADFALSGVELLEAMRASKARGWGEVGALKRLGVI